MYSVLAFDSPRLRMREGPHFRMDSGVSGVPAAAVRRRENHCGHASAQLLIHNRAHQRFELRRPVLDLIHAYAFDDRRHDGIVRPQMLDGLPHIPIQNCSRKHHATLPPRCGLVSCGYERPSLRALTRLAMLQLFVSTAALAQLPSNASLNGAYYVRYLGEDTRSSAAMSFSGTMTFDGAGKYTLSGRGVTARRP